MNYLKKLNSLFFFIILIYSGTLYAQKIEVLDSLSNEKIPNVAIFNSNQSRYTSTNESGEADITLFSINENIFFQLLGYKEKQLTKKDLINRNYQIKLVQDKKQLDEIILSVARSSSLKKKIAEKVNIITSSDIEFNNPSTGADLLGFSPGIRIQKSQGGGGSPVIRGFEANRVLLVIDGIRMNNAISRSGHLQNATTIDPNIIDRVEIIFGSSSVGYGSDALGGVVHYYTKTPEINSNLRFKNSFSSSFSITNLSILNNITSSFSSKKWASLTSISYSNFNDIKAGSNRLHGFKDWGLTPLYYPLNSSIYNLNSIKNPNYNIQKNTGYTQYSVFQKFSILLPQRLKLNLNFQLSNSSNISRYDKLNEYTNGELRFAEWYYGPQKRVLFSPQLKFYLGKKYLKKGTLTPAIQYLKESRINRKAGSLNKSFQEEALNVYSLNGDFEGSLTSKISFSYGFELVKNKLNSVAYSRKLLLENNTIIGLSNNKEIPSRYPSNGSSYSSLASYMNWVWDINNLMTINYGLRFSSTLLKASWGETASINALLSNYNINSKALTSTLGLTYRPIDKLKLKAILSSGFRNPNIDDLGKIGENNGLLTVPNTFLKPEYAYNFDFGINQLFNNNNEVSFRSFYSYISRYIVRSNYIIFADTSTSDPNTIIFDGNELITIANKNLGNRFVFGGSINSSLNLTSKVNIKANLTITKASNNKKYGPMPSISPPFGSLLFNYKEENLLLQGTFKFSDSKNPKNYSLGGEDGLEETPIIERSIINENTFFLYNGTPAWNIFSIKGNYILRKKVKLNFEIENLFDLHYREFASGISANGRSGSLGLKIDF